MYVLSKTKIKLDVVNRPVTLNWCLWSTQGSDFLKSNEWRLNFSRYFNLDFYRKHLCPVSSALCLNKSSSRTFQVFGL